MNASKNLHKKIDRLFAMYCETVNPTSRQMVGSKDFSFLDDGVREIPIGCATEEEVAVDRAAAGFERDFVSVHTNTGEDVAETEMMELVREIRREWREHGNQDFLEEIFDSPTKLLQAFGLLKKPKRLVAESILHDQRKRIHRELDHLQLDRPSLVFDEPKTVRRIDTKESLKVDLTPTEWQIVKKIYTSLKISKKDLCTFLTTLHKKKSPGPQSSGFSPDKNLDTHVSNARKKLTRIDVTIKVEATHHSIEHAMIPQPASE